MYVCVLKEHLAVNTLMSLFPYNYLVYWNLEIFCFSLIYVVFVFYTLHYGTCI